MSDEGTQASGHAAGGCACGEVAFRCALPPRFVAHCHCESCRRVHGAPFVTWAGFPDERFEVLRGAGSLRRWTSPAGSTWTSCAACGARLTYASPQWKDEVHVALAAFHDDVGMAPRAHVHADDAPSWAPIHDDLPRFGGPSGTDPL